MASTHPFDVFIFLYVSFNIESLIENSTINTIVNVNYYVLPDTNFIPVANVCSNIRRTKRICLFKVFIVIKKNVQSHLSPNSCNQSGAEVDWFARQPHRAEVAG